MELEIKTHYSDLRYHPMYKHLNSLEAVRTFMQYHVFAVWDFMSLLKSLQRKITCVNVPWKDSEFDPELVRLINEIVVAEESDVDQNNQAASHFALYLKAMEEIGADTKLIKNFLEDFDLSKLPKDLQEIVSFHLDIAINKEVHQVAASFFYGREKLIPDMFESVVAVLKENEMDCPTLIYYLERHIELDGDEHGPKALKCLQGLMDTTEKREQVYQVAIDSLKMRYKLWDFIEKQILSHN